MKTKLVLPNKILFARIIQKSSGWAYGLSNRSKALIKKGHSLERVLQPAINYSLLNHIFKFVRFVFLISHIWFLGFVCVTSTAYIFTTPLVTSYMIEKKLANKTTFKPIIALSLAQIGTGMQNMVLRLEDNNFYIHHGFSLGAMREALQRNQKYGKLIYGGSTISQQLARNLFLGDNRNLVRKYFEILAVIPMEFILGKKRILELYLNSIELGPGVFGLGQGANYQFKKAYSTTNMEERARLATIIASPLRYNVNNFWPRNQLSARYYAIR